LIEEGRAELHSEMSPVDKAIVLAGGVLEMIKKDISKFTILMDYLSDWFGLAWNWPIHDSSPGTFFTFLSNTVKKMESDIHCKISIMQEDKEARYDLENRVESILMSKEDTSAEGSTEDTSAEDSDLEEAQAVSESAKEASEKVKTLKQKLEESQKEVRTLEHKKIELQNEIEILKRSGVNAELLKQREKELAEVKQELKEVRDNHMETVIELSHARKKMERENSMKIHKVKEEKLKEKDQELEDLKSRRTQKDQYIVKVLQDYIDKISTLQEEIQTLKKMKQ